MRRLIEWCVLGIALAVVVAPPARGQAPAPAKPTPEHKRLGYFVGKWTSEGEMKPGPMGPGGKVSSSDACEWLEGGFAILCRYDSKGPAGSMKATGILGYSAEEKVYTYYGTNNAGMVMTAAAKGNVKGDTWTYDDEQMMGGQSVTSRVTIRERSSTSFTFTLAVRGPDGKWTTAMESTNTRQ